jgi:hypothetical protein
VAVLRTDLDTASEQFEHDRQAMVDLLCNLERLASQVLEVGGLRRPSSGIILSG